MNHSIPTAFTDAFSDGDEPDTRHWSEIPELCKVDWHEIDRLLMFAIAERCGTMDDDVNDDDRTVIMWLQRRLYDIAVNQLNMEPFSVSKQPISKRLRQQVFERDAYRCQMCGGWNDLSVDHIVPESLGGPTLLHNLQTLCRSCNSRKGVR